MIFIAQPLKRENTLIRILIYISNISTWPTIPLMSSLLMNKWGFFTNPFSSKESSSLRFYPWVTMILI